MRNSAIQLGLPARAEGRQPGLTAALAGHGDFMEDFQDIGPRIQREQMGKLACLLSKGIAAGEVLRKRFGQDLEGLRGRQDRPAVVAMIPQVIGNDHRQRNFHIPDRRGKAFHR